MKKVLVLSAICFFFSSIVFSQDKIYRKGGQTLQVKVVEIGVDEVKYKLFDEPDGPVYAIEKDRILKIVYQSGRIEVYQNNLKDPELYEGQAKNAIKMKFLSPLLGYTEIGYERNIKPGKSMEFSLGLVGLGKNHEVYFNYSWGLTEYKRSARGAYVSAGYKFSKLPDFINRNIRYTHVLQGFYVKPALFLGNYSENIVVEKSNQQWVVDRRSVVFGALMLDFGKQWVMGEKFLLDLHFGFGYSADNIKDNNNQSTFGDEYSAYHFGLARLGRNPGVGIMGGIRVGWLIKGKKDGVKVEEKK